MELSERFWQNGLFAGNYMELLASNSSHLPRCRVLPDNPPFTRIGVDYFGPFLVKRGRRQIKTFGVIVTCLAIHAVHLEVSPSLDTDKGSTNMGFLGPMPVTIREWENSNIQYIKQNSIYNILNVVVKYMWQRYVMEAGYLTNFIPNSKRFTYYQIKQGTALCWTNDVITPF